MKRRWAFYGLAVACLAGEIQGIIFVSSWWWFGLAGVYAAWGYVFGADEYRSDCETDKVFRWFDAILMGQMWPVGYPLTLIFHSIDFKEYDRGRHRQAQAHTSDPGPGTSSSTWAASSFSFTPAVGPRQQNIMNYPLPGPLHPALPTEPKVETVEGDMPILAHRAARIVVDRYGLHFAALNADGGTFEVDADAKCVADPNWRAYMTMRAQLNSLRIQDITPDHAAPALGCRCGFYAVPADVKAWHDNTTVDLLVELSGTVIEHEKGYRAAHQRVIELLLPRCCYCGRLSEFVGFAEHTAQLYTCGEHTTTSLVNVSRLDLGRQLGVPVGDEP